MELNDMLTKANFRVIIGAPKTHGDAMVSTGVLRYDKRGGLGNPVKLSNLKNKRQQNCCSCSVSCDAAL